jgi:hypothetical protein
MVKNTPHNRISDAVPGLTAGHFWGTAEVRARLKEAATVLRALALGGRDRPAGMAAHWPDVVRQGFEAYGREAVRLRPLAPTPAAISRADAAVLWLLWADDAGRRIAWARASGIPWRKLEDMDGRSHTTLRRIEAEAFAAICRHLNAGLSRKGAVAAAFAQARAGKEGSTTKDKLTGFRK